MRYKVCSKDGFIAGTYSREELRPQVHVIEKSMWINTSELERRNHKALTPL
jgi:hypothetical protein